MSCCAASHSSERTVGFSVVPPEMKPEDMFWEKKTDRGQ